MRRLLVVSLVALAGLLAACSSSAAPGWTYAPPTEAPASGAPASGEPSAAPSGEASAAPSGEASAGPSAELTPVPGGESPAAGDVVSLTAQGIAFVETELTAPADTPFTIRFDNQDAGVPHNVEIKDASSQVLFKGDIFNGVASMDYQVPALPAGTYQFLCIVHPNMVGTLTVGG